MNVNGLTAVVVAYNEARRLRSCLRSLRFCSDRLLVDLGSTDAGERIAEEEGVAVLRRPRCAVVEEVRTAVIPALHTDWVLFADPDEVIPSALGGAILRTVAQPSDVGLIRLPYRFYFLGRPLYSTFWGRACVSVPRVFHRDRVQFSDLVHRGFRVVSPFSEIQLPAAEGGEVQHYWADSYSQLFRKHWRYSRAEGRSMFECGLRFGWRRSAGAVWATLKQDLIEYEGLRAGYTGIFLSLFHAWYVSASHLSLRRHEMERLSVSPRAAGTQSY